MQAGVADVYSHPSLVEAHRRALAPSEMEIHLAQSAARSVQWEWSVKHASVCSHRKVVEGEAWGAPLVSCEGCPGKVGASLPVDRSECHLWSKVGENDER